MRKTLLLLASLGIISAAYAEQPTLVVTNIGQEIEIENQSGGADFDDTWLFNMVGLKYGDWTFGLKAGKMWSTDFTDGIHGKSHRLELDVWKKVTDDLKLGVRYRGQKDRDRLTLRYDYNNGFLWSAGDFWYQSNNEINTDNGDNYEIEWFPLGFQYGPFKAGYFINGIWYVGDMDKEQQESYVDHQIRSYLTLYSGEKLTVNAEWRLTLNNTNKYEDRTKVYREYDDFGRNRIYLGASYQVNENLNVYGKYGYEFRDWKYSKGTEEDWLKSNSSQENYQNIIVGWKYTF